MCYIACIFQMTQIVSTNLLCIVSFSFFLLPLVFPSVKYKKKRLRPASTKLYNKAYYIISVYFVDIKALTMETRVLIL